MTPPKTSKAEATARPWRVLHNGKTAFIQTAERGYVAKVFGDERCDNAEANAALIIKAANEYDALNMIAERLKAFCHVFENSDPDTSLGIQVTKGKAALSALAALRSKEGK